VANLITEYPHFFTTTNLEWKELWFRDKYKDIVIESMRLLVKNMGVIIYGFVIMNNRIHIHENPVGASRCKYSDDYNIIELQLT
jgi:putative transposase